MEDWDRDDEGLTLGMRFLMQENIKRFHNQIMVGRCPECAQRVEFIELGDHYTKCHAEAMKRS